MSKRKGGSRLDNVLAKFQKVQEQSAKIQIDAAKDRAKLDAAQRLKAAAEAEAKAKEERERASQALSAPTHQHEVATNVLMKQKRVMDLLHRTRKPLSVAELHNELGFPVDRGELWDMLLNNDKVLYNTETRRFSYKAKHVLEGKREMLALIQKHPDGILMDDVVDAYQTANVDAEDLLAGNAVISLVNSETRERVLYPVDDAYEVEVDDNMAAMFHAVEIPTHDADFDAAIRKVGAEPAPRRAIGGGPGANDDEDEEGEGGKKRGKKKRAVNFERMKVTNVHLPELFKAPQVDRLDG